jgi:hypothetical protein
MKKVSYPMAEAFFICLDWSKDGIVPEFRKIAGRGRSALCDQEITDKLAFSQPGTYFRAAVD